jgi:hypothetical protein
MHNCQSAQCKYLCYAHNCYAKEYDTAVNTEGRSRFFFILNFKTFDYCCEAF